MSRLPPSVYKIFRPDEWQELSERGVFTGSSDDRRDGFIHLSTEEQVPGTLKRHYRGVERVIVARITAEGLPIVMEPSRGGQLFPHLYGELPRSAVRSFEEKTLDSDAG